MSFFKEKPLDVSPFFSEDMYIKEKQEKAEEFKIHDAIKNIVNRGNGNENERGQVEWETCTIYYRPVLATMHTAEAFFVLGKITMQDGTILYESEMRSHSFDGINHRRVRYTTKFLMGKWVDRLLKYSEDVSKQYQESIKKKELDDREEKLKPFSEIAF